MTKETDDGAFLSRMGTNAQVWANEFCKMYPENDEETMVGWFANAIMAGHDWGRSMLLNNPDYRYVHIAALPKCSTCGHLYIDHDLPFKGLGLCAFCKTCDINSADKNA